MCLTDVTCLSSEFQRTPQSHTGIEKTEKTNNQNHTGGEKTEKTNNQNHTGGDKTEKTNNQNPLSWTGNRKYRQAGREESQQNLIFPPLRFRLPGVECHVRMRQPRMAEYLKTGSSWRIVWEVERSNSLVVVETNDGMK